ncbi:hypothetical protein V7T16_04255 [Vibrio metoecus]|uniref:hypothetical protein n=1 Tax=Vibrio metoecus TaxID=1481663 RepID=UPI000AB67F32|nr:hypothetical protein [Vibrio metoecus]
MSVASNGTLWKVGVLALFGTEERLKVSSSLSDELTYCMEGMVRQHVMTKGVVEGKSGN